MLILSGSQHIITFNSYCPKCYINESKTFVKRKFQGLIDIVDLIVNQPFPPAVRIIMDRILLNMISIKNLQHFIQIENSIHVIASFKSS